MVFLEDLNEGPVSTEDYEPNKRLRSLLPHLTAATRKPKPAKAQAHGLQIVEDGAWCEEGFQLQQNAFGAFTTVLAAEMTIAKDLLTGPEGDEPSSMAKALAGPHAAEWQKAFAAEIENLIRHGTLNFTNQKPANLVTSKWVTRTKRLPEGLTFEDGALHRRKARIVARGFSQKEGIDYEETFASTACSAS